MYFKCILLDLAAQVNDPVFIRVVASQRSGAQNMKKPHPEHEKKFVAGRGDLSDPSLVESCANRLRKNLCQALSSLEGNSLHCGSVPKWGVIG